MADDSKQLEGEKPHMSCQNFETKYNQTNHVQ